MLIPYNSYTPEHNEMLASYGRKAGRSYNYMPERISLHSKNSGEKYAVTAPGHYVIPLTYKKFSGIL